MTVIDVDFKAKRERIIAVYNIEAIGSLPRLTIELLETNKLERRFSVSVEDEASFSSAQLQQHPFYMGVVSPWLDNGVIPSIGESDVLTDFDDDYIPVSNVFQFPPKGN